MRQVDAFIRHVLGFDPRWLGDVLAYFGMVETHGRGTLHIHLLIWLRSCPPNSAEIESMLGSTNAEQFRESVQAFARSIVCVSVWRSIIVCKAPLVDLIPLPIPERARKDPMSGLYSSRAKARVVEPALRRCAICNTNFSSQHILRDVLLKSRPAHWPRWEGALTYSEMVK
ncbi:hypothetical protein JG688_00011286 [Phytophthora aleatoria]|uniref:Helitron helicase-like domain-containing protein n=1 Tax=Phytophthora aleatoria TaxID=2496075 RepID=A0A8J5IUQ3_9STRA|nr:hypothetical protein JG688_00011286 [Phytophthora aleatoria]